MGAKQTKMEGEYLPQTPQQPISIQTDFKELESMDPRSPHTCRTPLNEIIDKQKEMFQQISPIAAIPTDHPLGLLRKRFFKGFSYNLNDPRSPSSFLNRTPLIFDDAMDRTLDLDDTFSDLFVESKIPHVEIYVQEQPTPKEPEQEDVQPEEQTETNSTQPEEIIVEADPRSPSIGVERTPIIITDDAAFDEDNMIEKFLSTLSMNMAQKPPTNKPLDRIRNKKKPPRKCSSTTRKNMIYEDCENRTPPKAQRTTETNIDSPSSFKRTPLSCVKNHPHLRSRSVEVSGKSLKSRLPLTSFDDALHKITPVKKILRYSNMENIENSFEF